MRKTFIVLAAFFAVLGITFTILPLGTIALLPALLALLMSFIALKTSEQNKRLTPKYILLISTLILLIIICKTLLIKDEVVSDKQFNQEKIDSKKNAQKDLEELEGLE